MDAREWRVGGEAGYTLVELLLAMAASLIVMAAFYRTFIFQDEVQQKQERLMEANQNARNTMDLLGRDLRMLGMGAPSSVQKITSADKQTITYLVNYYSVRTALTAQAAAGATALTVSSSSDFASGQTIYISDGANSESATLAAAPPSATQITLPAGLTNSYPAGSTVDVVGTVTFSFDGAPKEIKRNLYGGGAEVVSSNVDYLQFTYYDSSNAQLGSLAAALTSAERDSVSRINVQVITRTSKEDGATQTVTYGDGTDNAPGDGYVRVYLESDVRLRNM